MIHFVIALQCEAQPLIHHYRMKPCGGRGRAQFYECENARLAVTGVGSLSSAIATTAMGERFLNEGILWLNVGICGSADAGIGNAFIGNRVASESFPSMYYPQLPGKSPWPGAGIKTLKAPSEQYETEWLFDMEAFGYFAAALSFGMSENVQSLKIVSDNATHRAGRNMDKAKISRLVAAQIPSIESFAATTEKSRSHAELSQWASDLQNEAKAFYAFTATEQHQLSTRIRQLDALVKHDEPLPSHSFLQSKEKRAFLAALQFEIDQRSTQEVC